MKITIVSCGYHQCHTGTATGVYLDDKSESVITMDRGINVVRMNPSSGAIIDTCCFDTHGGYEGPQALADYIQGYGGQPALWLVAVRDEATRCLTPGCKAVIKTLGANAIESVQFRAPYIFCVRVHGRNNNTVLLEKVGGTNGRLTETLSITTQAEISAQQERDRAIHEKDKVARQLQLEREQLEQESKKRQEAEQRVREEQQRRVAQTAAELRGAHSGLDEVEAQADQIKGDVLHTLSLLSLFGRLPENLENMEAQLKEGDRKDYPESSRCST